MEFREYKNIFENEDSHFLYVARHELIISALRKHLAGKSPKNLKILDAGCGAGGLAKKLGRFGRVRGIDINKEALKFSKKRGIRVKKGSVTNIPFINATFDVVVCVDVIYHKAVEDDKKALSEFFRVLRPGGFLILRVPANKWLRLKHDLFVHTRERYNKEEIEKKLKRAGFVIKKLSFVDSLLLFPAIIKCLLEKLPTSQEPESGIKPLPKLINGLLSNILTLEIRLLSKTDLPFGLGIIAVCQKPS